MHSDFKLVYNISKETGETMQPAQRDNIVTDLLRKRPEGPTRSTRRSMVYGEQQIYDDLASKYRDVVVSENVPNFGYDIQDLFELDLHDHVASHTYLSKRFFQKDSYELTKGQKISISRKLNRLWQRLKGPLEEMQKIGGSGIYSVKTRWGSEALGHLVASDKESAKQMAEVFYSFLTERRLEVTYIRSGDFSQMKEFNQQLLVQKEKNISRRLERITEIENSIEEARRVIQVIKTVQDGQLKVNGDE